MTLRSMFRRAAWMKWFPPMANRSPSPPNTGTSSSGFARFRPGPNGMARASGGVEGVHLQVAGDAPGAANAGDDNVLGSGLCKNVHSVGQAGHCGAETAA